MLEFPVNVSKSEDGQYEARLADVPDGPVGFGSDPYAALSDLKSHVPAALKALEAEGELPSPSSIDDRPVVEYSGATDADASGTMIAGIRAGGVKQNQMLGYSWTNDVVFPDK